MKLTFFGSFLGLASLVNCACVTGPCNTNDEYCDRKYSNVSLVGTHDSAFDTSLGDPRDDQDELVTLQLDSGIRFLQSQVHYFNNSLSMCHTSCALLYAGTLHDYLVPIKTWLDSNENDVLTLLIVNGDRTNITEFAKVFADVGLDKMAFIPATSPKTLSIDDWPTYAELIEAETRVVIFIDSGADETQVPYILYEWNYFFETPYDVLNGSFNECTLDRPPNSSPDGKMYIMNHFLNRELVPGIDIPDTQHLNQTNAATGNGSIGAQADLCEQTYGRGPDMVLVNFFEYGDVFTAQSNLNAV